MLDLIWLICLASFSCLLVAFGELLFSKYPVASWGSSCGLPCMFFFALNAKMGFELLEVYLVPPHVCENETWVIVWFIHLTIGDALHNSLSFTKPLALSIFYFLHKHQEVSQSISSSLFKFVLTLWLEKNGQEFHAQRLSSQVKKFLRTKFGKAEISMLSRDWLSRSSR